MPGTMSSVFFFVVVFVISRIISVIGQVRPWSALLPTHLLDLDIASRLHFDPLTTIAVSTDFGNMVKPAPAAAVLFPSSVDDIAALIKTSYLSANPFPIAARGHGHSIHGQATAPKGVVINMHSLGDGVCKKKARINVSSSSTSGVFFADVGGEQLWIDVLEATLEHGLTPRSWTDYLYLTVGGTLSNGGISGQVHRHGPQIANVYEMDVVTGKGEVVTCSRELNSDLFHAALGGLGQFGVITRARIALERAPQRARWIRLLYDDFSAFTRDQERLISMEEGDKGFDYLEGSLISDESLLNNWRSSFFSEADGARIRSLTTTHGLIYCLELSKYYDKTTAHTLDQEISSALAGLSFIPGLVFSNDVTYVEFLNRVHRGELKLRDQGLWDVPHPWLNLFVPKSRIHDFDAGVFRRILRQNSSTGPILIYPMKKTKWDAQMSTAVPDEEFFYSIGLLRSATDAWEYLENQNKEILRFCEKSCIGFKQYLPHYETRADWEKHFGPKWEKFLAMKTKYDPEAILSPGQKIFTSL
ncbi:cytokinin dehydrogenase 5-like isoform X2 [Aristolochia californica]|uniref:cytokinin dehydrogenase 5-like isoform X2 n=1 Tax=Aristolochia californica TaxID=171875 RepID=UPI0035DDC353